MNLPGIYNVYANASWTDRNNNVTRETYGTSAALTYIAPVPKPGDMYVGAVNESIQFNGDDSYDKDGAILSYEWDFGDGNNSMDENPIYAYSESGIYTVILNVTDDDGLFSNISTLAVVGIPYIKFTKPYRYDILSGNVMIEWIANNPNGDDSDLLISLYQTTDNVFNESEIYWVLIEENIENSGFFIWNTSLLNDSFYALKIVAIDPFGLNGTDYILSIMIGQPPETPYGTTIGIIEKDYDFTTTKQYSSGGQLYYMWSWGDGNFSGWLGPYNSGENCTTSHNWSDYGIYDISVRAKNATWDFLSDWSEALQVDIDSPPIPSYSYTPSNPNTQDIIHFNDSSIDLDGIIVNWSWVFGDGNISYNQNAIHQYDIGAYYIVNLTVSDDDGYQSSIDKQVYVIDILPVADFDYSPLLPDVGESVFFTDNSYDLDDTIISWYWNFGDGNTSVLQNPIHQYTSSGVYTVTLQVTNDDGITDSSAKLVLVDIQIMNITNPSTGWNFISAPYNFTQDSYEFIIKHGDYYYNWTMATTDINPTGSPLVNSYMFGWNRTQQTYSFETNLNPGFGCWVYAYQPCEIWIQEDTIPVDENITDLEQGWNIVGVPYNENVSKDDILVNDTEWDTAVNNSWINDYIFGWNRQEQRYDIYETFMPGYAYWIYAYQPCTLKKAI